MSEQHHSRAASPGVLEPPAVTPAPPRLSSVLVVSDTAEYAAAFAAADSPARVASSDEVLSRSAPAADACVIVGTLPDIAEACVAALHPTCSILVVFGADARHIAQHRILHVAEAHPDACVVIAFASLLSELNLAQKQTKAAEQNAQREQQHATLGRYMLQVRHEVNNVLTSIIGNTELLQMRDAETDPAECSEQLDTVHAMSLRLHEILQRFSSLDAEMRLSSRPSQSENEKQPPRYLAHEADGRTAPKSV